MGLIKFFGLDNIKVLYWKNPIEFPELKTRDDMVRILVQYENGSYESRTLIGDIPITYHNWFVNYICGGNNLTGCMIKWAYLD